MDDIDKLNYMIHLLEEKQDEKTNNVTEEVILYSFLGVFIIFIVDSFSRIGKYAMVGGLSRITHDVPPYTIGAGIPYKIGGLNLIGLKRKGFSYEDRRALTQAFKLTYRSGLHLVEALEQIRNEIPLNEHVQHWIQFCSTSKRGLIGLQGVSQSHEEVDQLEELL